MAENTTSKPDDTRSSATGSSSTSSSQSTSGSQSSQSAGSSSSSKSSSDSKSGSKSDSGSSKSGGKKKADARGPVTKIKDGNGDETVVYPGMTIGYSSGNENPYEDNQYQSDAVNDFYADRAKNGVDLPS